MPTIVLCIHNVNTSSSAEPVGDMVQSGQNDVRVSTFEKSCAERPAAEEVGTFAQGLYAVTLQDATSLEVAGMRQSTAFLRTLSGGTSAPRELLRAPEEAL